MMDEDKTVDTSINDRSADGGDNLGAEVIETPGVEDRTLEKVMEDNFFRYSMSVIIDRALPDARDGLKPVHRRILYSMNQNGNRSTSKFVKSARIVGDVMGKYHPHGDSAIYNSMVRLAQGWSLRYPLIQGQGNFGSMDGDEPAAMRYTEARMAKVADEMLVDIDKDTIDFRDNFDGSEQEPVVLPAKLPNLLLNGQIGIAVGMATNIPSHNLGEVVDATVELIDNPDASIDDLLKHVKGPDFPTGAIVYGGASMRQAYQTGRGSVTMRAVAEIVEAKKGKHNIVISEIPYGVNKATLIEKIADLVKNKKIVGISDLNDASARGEVKVVVELRKDAYPKKVLNQLYKLTSLQTSFHYNMLALVNGVQPKVLGLHDILREYIAHRQSVVRRRTEFELRKARDEAHVLEGLKIALDNIDEVIKLIRGSKDYDTALKGLMKSFKLTEVQGKAILAMQLRKLTGLDRQAIEDRLAELLKLIGELEAILADGQKILDIIKAELAELKERYGDERRSQIINHELGKFSDEELIPDEESVILLTNENYIKRTLLSDYRRQNRGGKGKRSITTKEEDIISQVVPANTHDFLLFFTNRGRVFRLRAYEVPAAGLGARGVAAVNLLQLQPEEKITAIVKYGKDAQDEGYLFMTTVKGTVKKTPIKDYANIRTNGLIAINLDEGDELRWIQRTSGEHDIIISTSAGQAIRFSEKDARPMGRAARGVRGVRLRPNDCVVGMDIVTQDNQVLLVISEKGFGKRTKASNFPTHKRGGVGIKAAIVTAKTGPIISVQTIEPNMVEAILVSRSGQTIRLALDDIKLLGRTTQGVTIMRLGSGDAVSSIGLMEKSEQEEESGE